MVLTNDSDNLTSLIEEWYRQMRYDFTHELNYARTHYQVKLFSIQFDSTVNSLLRPPIYVDYYRRVMEN